MTNSNDNFQGSYSRNENADVFHNERVDISIADELIEFLSENVYKGYCVGEYYSEYDRRNVLIIFDCKQLIVPVYPFWGCAPNVFVKTRCNCVAGEAEEDIEVSIYETDFSKAIVEEFLHSYECAFGETDTHDIYGEEYLAKYQGINFNFYEDFGYDTYYVVEKKNG